MDKVVLGIGLGEKHGRLEGHVAMGRKQYVYMALGKCATME